MPKNKIKHVAIIMDGNGRWAQNRAHRRIWGHVRGARVVSSIVEEASALGISALTLYAFSTENWSRPVEEVSTLFTLLRKFLLQEEKRIIKNSIRFRVIGDVLNLPKETQEVIKGLEDKTKDMDGLKLSFAFSYGSRAEIIRAVNVHINSKPGALINEIDLSSNLFVPDVGDVDLLIRTGGDQRVSNFLLWQSAYAELFFTNTRWPEFSKEEFSEIIKSVSKRERRFGAINAQISLEDTKIKAQRNISFLGKQK